MTRIFINDQSFAGRFRLLLGGLTVFCLLLAGATWLQGPRVRSATFGGSRVTSLANQRLILQINEPVEAVDAKQMTVTPAARFTVSSSGNTVVVQFSEPLRFATRYHVTIHSGKHTFGYAFTTRPATVFYATMNGEIHRRTLPDGPDKVVFTGGQADDFAVLGNTLVVSARHTDDTNLLTIFNMTTKKSTPIALPASGSIARLRVAPDGQSFGFVFTASKALSDINRNLMLYHVSSGRLTPVTGFNDQPVHALDWRYAADSRTIVAQQFDSNVLLLSPKHAPVPLGQFSSMYGLSYDNSSIVLGQLQTGILKLDIRTTQHTQLPDPAQGGAYLTGADPLRASLGYLLHIQTAVDGSLSQQLIVERDGVQHTIYNVNYSDAYITHADMSSNDHLVIVNKNTTSDNTPSTDIVDMLTGKKIVNLPGDKVHWQE